MALVWSVTTPAHAQVPAQTPAAIDPFADPRVKEIESHLRCSCGCNLDIWTCQRQMYCEISPAMSARVRQRLAEGTLPEVVLAEFVAERGETVLMAPPKEGFNWAGYLLPFVAIAAAVIVVAGLIRRRSRMAPASEGSAVDVSAEQLARLEAELARLDEDR
ncbi:MAG: cytochrome c-type biogenesis protein CcmH [Gemmatimonadetes bacterium]|nr:cytochrome c-type biogenesis protein CcmH [Gemmatimonadota bacterium]